MEEIGIIRRTIQDVLVPEMQGLKERMAGHDERLASIDRRFDQVEKRLEHIEKRLEAVEKSLVDLRSEMHQGFAALRATLDRIEARLQFLDFDKRLYRVELLLEQGRSGPKSSAA